MTYDQLVDAGRTADRAALLARAEAQIVEAMAAAAQMPAALLPEFSDSRDEPNGPTHIAMPDVLEVWVAPRGHYLLGLSTLQDGWATGDFAKFVLAMWSVVGFIPPCGNEPPRTAPSKARRVAAFGVRFEITEAGRAALDEAESDAAPMRARVAHA